MEAQGEPKIVKIGLALNWDLVHSDYQPRISIIILVRKLATWFIFIYLIFFHLMKKIIW